MKVKFKIGGIYTAHHDRKVLLRFVGINKTSGLVFEPLNEMAYVYYEPYDKNDEEKDPLCKEGYIGFLTGTNLKEYNNERHD